MKNLKNKTILYVALVFLIVLGTIFGLATYVSAEIDVSQSQLESKGQGSPAPGYVTLKDLRSRYDILCSKHGEHLPSYNNTLLITERGMLSEGYLKQTDIGKRDFYHVSASETENSPFKKGTYENQTYGYYKKKATYVAKPMEAYVLSEMVREKMATATDTNVQIAWWNTEAGMKGVLTAAPEALTLEARDFEAYIEKIAVSTNPSTFTLQDYEFQVNGVTYAGQIEAPVLKYEPSYNKDANQDG